jgi:hypothetical protein
MIGFEICRICKRRTCRAPGPQGASLLQGRCGLREIPHPILAREKLWTGAAGRRIFEGKRAVFLMQIKCESRKTKDVKMKSAPNKLLKTKGQISDIMDYPNKLLKKDDLKEILD